MVFKLNVDTIGSIYSNIPASLPHLSFPKINLGVIEELISPAITIAILAGVESLLSAVVADGMTGGNHRSNMELVAQGIGNVASAFFGGIPATGAIARTAANIKNGGRTPVAGIVHSITLIFIMIILMPYVKLIPMPSLAAILIMVSYNMGEWHAFKRILRAPKSDAIIFLSAFFLTVFLDLVVAIEVGVVLSAFLFMRRMAEFTNVKYVSFDDEEMDEVACTLMDKDNIDRHVSFYEINGPFFFGAADKFVEVIREMEIPTKILILKMGLVPVMDATAYHGFEMLHEICERHGTKLIIMDIQEQPRKVLKKYGFIERIGEDMLCEGLEEAIGRANELLTIKRAV
jgi:SulP family sulfate permease